MNKSEKSNGKRQKHRPGIVKFSIPMANDTLVSFSLGFLIFSRMKETQEERNWPIMDCEPPLSGIVGL